MMDNLNKENMTWRHIWKVWWPWPFARVFRTKT